MTQALILPELEQAPALPDTGEALIREVENGLASSPRSLAPWMFYDAWGSCLFERITTLAEYYPSRIEREILARFAEEIVGRRKPNRLKCCGSLSWALAPLPRPAYCSRPRCAATDE